MAGFPLTRPEVGVSVLLSVLVAVCLQVSPPATPSSARTSVMKGPPMAPPPPPNVVIVLADDFGVDLVGAYGEGADPPCTPTLDLLAQQGLLFRNAWANPTCSPTRAAVLTGRHGFRTGIGSPVTSSGLQPNMNTILPEMLNGYANAAVGKWHLANGQNDNHPGVSGFDRFAGTISGALPSYDDWTKVTDGQSSPTKIYATTDTTDEAIGAVQSLPEPFFLYVSYHAPHSPHHVPDSSLCPPGSPACPHVFCGNLPPNPSAADRVKAMTEALDTEFARLMATIDDQAPNTVVIFMGDNGTAPQASQPPFANGHAKGTVYEGGVNVPLIVRGPGVDAGETQALVSAVDLFATCAELAGVRATTEDSVSMVPCFSDAALSPRATVYSEGFSPNHGTLPFSDHDRAVRGPRYKLIRRTGQPDELYDLWTDAFETDDLLAPAFPGLSVEEQEAYDALAAELTTLGVG